MQQTGGGTSCFMSAVGTLAAGPCLHGFLGLPFLSAYMLFLFCVCMLPWISDDRQPVCQFTGPPSKGSLLVLDCGPRIAVIDFVYLFETGSHSVAQTDPELTVICLSQHQPLLVGTDCTLGVSHEEHWELVHVCKRVYSDWHVASNFPFLQCLNFWNQVFADYKNEFECSPLLRFSGHILDNHYLLLKFLWPPSWLQFFFSCFVFLGMILLALKLIPLEYIHISIYLYDYQ